MEKQRTELYQNARLKLVIETAQNLALSCLAALALKKEKPLPPFERKFPVVQGFCKALESSPAVQETGWRRDKCSLGNHCRNPGTKH